MTTPKHEELEKEFEQMKKKVETNPNFVLRERASELGTKWKEFFVEDTILLCRVGPKLLYSKTREKWVGMV